MSWYGYGYICLSNLDGFMDQPFYRALSQHHLAHWSFASSRRHYTEGSYQFILFNRFSLDSHKRCETKLQKQICTNIDCSSYCRVLFISYFTFIRAREYRNFVIHLMCMILPSKVSFLQAAAISQQHIHSKVPTKFSLRTRHMHTSLR